MIYEYRIKPMIKIGYMMRNQTYLEMRSARVNKQLAKMVARAYFLFGISVASGVYVFIWWKLTLLPGGIFIASAVGGIALFCLSIAIRIIIRVAKFMKIL